MSTVREQEQDGARARVPAGGGAAGSGDPAGTAVPAAADDGCGLGLSRGRNVWTTSEDMFTGPAAPRLWADASTGPSLPGEYGKRDLWIPRVGQPSRYKWAFAAVWLIYLVGPLFEAAHMDRSLGWKVLVFVLTVGYMALYATLAFVAFPNPGYLSAAGDGGRAITEGRRSRFALPLVLAMFATATFSTLVVDNHLIGMWVYVGAGSGLSLPLERRVAQRFVLAGVVGVSVCSLIVHLTVAEWLSLLFPTFFAGLATIGIRQMAGLISELRKAREQVARLAANEERLRLARDLHDLTGHSLSTITLKAQLAQRLLAKVAEESGPLPDARLAKALTETEEIEQVSRQTLTDIREAVSGYRRATFAVETASAAAALEAAGIKFTAEPSLTAASGVYDEEAENALAWCLREAVTNAIRHSGAETVRARLAEQDGELRLVVRNDGRGLATAAGEEHGGAEAAGASGSAGGNGLAGLRERLNAVDGRLSLGGPDGDFSLVAAVPLSRAVRRPAAD